MFSPAVVYMALIFTVSSLSLPHARMPRHSDKLIHLVEYAVLAALLTLGLRWSRRGRPPLRVAAWSFLVAATYAATDELHQAFVPLRHCSLYDWIADAIGAALAAVLLALAWPNKETDVAHDPSPARQDP